MKWLNEDGSMNVTAFDELEANMRAVTDRNKEIDGILKAARMGREMTAVFQCGHSGLYYPGDYVKEWGRLYGIGLGPHPVSEVLDTEYEVAPPEITSAIESLEQIMHPVSNCFAQVDLDLVDVGTIQFATTAREDKQMRVRARIVRAKQMQNPKCRLHTMAALWAQVRRD